jgi:hypothetical protein
MPQASSELNEEWDGPGDETAMAYLVAEGWMLRPDWCWVRPEDDKRIPTLKEASAMRFLIDEWDFGGWR